MSPALELLTPTQRVAIVLLQLDQNVQNEILSKFSEREVVRVVQAMANAPAISPDLVRTVVGDVLAEIGSLYRARQGGLEIAEQVLIARLGPKRAAEILAQLRNEAPRELPFDFMIGIDPVQVAGICAAEHPQAVAVVLAHLDRDIAADVMSRLEESLRSDLAFRVAKLRPLPLAVVEVLSNTLESRLSNFVRSGSSSSEVDGVTATVRILSGLSRADERQILSQIEEKDADLAERIQSEMFGWDDVVELDRSTLMVVLREVSMPDLAIALKNKDTATITKFKSALTERQLEDLEDELAAMGKIKLSLVEQHEAAIVKAVRTLAEAGEIDIVRSENEILV